MIPTAYSQAIAERFPDTYAAVLKSLEPMFNDAYDKGTDCIGLKDVTAESVSLALEELYELGALDDLGKGVVLLPKVNHQTRFPEAVPMLNYTFMLRRAIDSGFIEKAEANLVFSNDDFRFKSRNERVYWRPSQQDRGELRCAFVTIATAEGLIHTTLMTVDQLSSALVDAREKLFGGFLPLHDQAEYALGSCVRRAIPQWQPYSYSSEERSDAFEHLMNLVHFHHRHFEEFDSASANEKVMKAVGNKRHVAGSPSPLQALIAGASVKLDAKRQQANQSAHKAMPVMVDSAPHTEEEVTQINWSGF
ncbi:recombinase RecT [Ferrimonas kyonanensis]|uniref:recombinase RecT n=1 Tax=Ferrimonas kyonanensis TaxID=364763 RepID=UPI00040992A1|nr:recombinase RecT [Ferrimonas kyonanensis]